MADERNQATALSTGNTLQINKYLPVTILYFFLNSFLLPHGLLYTALLTPFFLVWLYNSRVFSYVWIFFLLSIPYAIIHILNGIEITSYLKSYTLLFSVFVFGLAFYQFLRVCKTLSAIFKTVILLNSFLVLIAVIALVTPALQKTFWHVSQITSGVGTMNRLKMLTYEASYYSFLLVPVVMYYYLKMFLLYLPNKWFVFWLITIPLLLSLSFGVIAAILVTLILLMCSDMKLLSLNKKLPVFIVTSLILFCLIAFIALRFFPGNIVFVRIANIFQGRDTSFSGRTFDSLYLGWKLAEQKSILFGAGPGQIKIIGLDLFKEYYRYEYFTPNQIAVPNSTGDLLATFGLTGVITKLGLEIYFFLKTKVYSNFYRLTLFLFIFIYQFTGSYLTNIAEYVIWIMAFYPFLFREFDKRNIYKID